MKRLSEEKGFPPGEDGYFRARKVGTLGVPASTKSSISSALRQRSQIMNSSILPHRFLSNLLRLLSYQFPIFTLPGSILVEHISCSKRKKIIEIAGRPSSSTHYSHQGCGSRHRDRGAPRISPSQIPAQYNLSSYHWHEWLPCR